MNSVFYSVKPTGTIISVGAHGGAKPQSNSDVQQHVLLDADIQGPASLDLDTNQPVSSVVVPSCDRELASVGLSNQEQERNSNQDSVSTEDSVSESGE